ARRCLHAVHSVALLLHPVREPARADPLWLHRDRQRLRHRRARHRLVRRHRSVRHDRSGPEILEHDLLLESRPAAPDPDSLFLIMTPIEIVSKLTKPFALTIRLFANMTAGHVVLLVLISLIFTFHNFAIAVAPVA